MINRKTALGLLLAFLAGVALVWSIQKLNAPESSTAASATNKDANLPVPIASDDPAWGSPNAPVTMVVFSDYQCPFCSRLENTMRQIRKTYGPEKVRIVWKEFPLSFHEHARPAAIASATVFALGGNDAFWRFHELAFSHQRQLDRDHFVSWAKRVGVDEKKFVKALNSNTYAAKVDRDLALGRELGIHGTPHVIVNGIQISGAQPFAKFRQVIDQQLQRAEELLKQGTKPERLYESLLEANWGKDAGAGKSNEHKERKAEAQQDTTVWKVPVGNSPIRGPKDAPVTIVLFSDFQCPFCKRVEPVLQRVMKAYPGQVRIVWKDRPLSFHRRAEACAEFARAARALQGDEGFWKAHDALFESNPKLEDEDLEKIANKLHLPWKKIKHAIDNQDYLDAIDADNELAQRLKANGTPHMFINGRRLVGALPFERFKELIDEQLHKTDNLLKQGVKKSELYDRLMAKAKEPPPLPPPPKKNLPAPTKNNPWKGAKNAKIVLQLVSDFQCPFCARVEPTIRELLRKHDGELKVVWIDNPLPFHKNAMLAAEAAREVFAQKGSAGFWKYHDMLFEHQRTPHGLERPALEQYAEQLGCDMKKFREALDKHTHKKEIEEEKKMVEKASIRGTPGIVINGYFVGGALPMSEFEKAIKHAKRDLKKHVK